MSEKVLKWLHDILGAIDEIDSYFDLTPRFYEAFRDNTLLKRAIERDLEIIGEAMNRILKEDPEFPIEYARNIIGLRNQIIHGYDSVSDELIWAIVQRNLPQLREDVTRLVSSNE